MIAAIVGLASLVVAGEAAAATNARRLLLEYDGGAYGVIPLGRATLDMSLDPEGGYRAGATIESSGLAALFDNTRLEAEAEGVVSPGGVGWRRYRLDHSYAKKRRVTFMQPAGDDVAALITPKFSDAGRPPPTAEQRREARDPLSSLMAMAVKVGADGACDGAFPTFDGKYRYDLTLAPEGTGAFKGGGYEGRVLRCKIRYRPVAGYRTPRDMEKRIPQGEIWFALDAAEGYAPPVRVSAPLPLGWAAIRLKSMRRADVSVEMDVEAAPDGASAATAP